MTFSLKAVFASASLAHPSTNRRKSLVQPCFRAGREQPEIQADNSSPDPIITIRSSAVCTSGVTSP